MIKLYYFLTGLYAAALLGVLLTLYEAYTL